MKLRVKNGTDGLLRERRKDGCVHPFEQTEPTGYVAWFDWAEKYAETHNQEQCPLCGLWVIYTPKTALALAPGTPETPEEGR